MSVMWKDAEEFYYHIIKNSSKNAEKVHVMFSIGNHDESMAWAFAKSLENKFQLTDNIDFDTEFKERKAILLGKNFLGTTHGDKNRRNLAANFSVEFPGLRSEERRVGKECRWR